MNYALVSHAYKTMCVSFSLLLWKIEKKKKTLIFKCALCELKVLISQFGLISYVYMYGFLLVLLLVFLFFFKFILSKCFCLGHQI